MHWMCEARRFGVPLEDLIGLDQDRSISTGFLGHPVCSAADLGKPAWLVLLNSILRIGGINPCTFIIGQSDYVVVQE